VSETIKIASWNINSVRLRINNVKRYLRLRKPDVLLVSARLPVLDGPTVLRLVRRRLSVPVVLGVGPEDTDMPPRAKRLKSLMSFE
jgi:DNA-binding response OmpR family regulator